MISEKGLELNGRKGRILQWNPEKGRYAVQLIEDTSTRCWIKPINLILTKELEKEKGICCLCKESKPDEPLCLISLLQFNNAWPSQGSPETRENNKRQKQEACTIYSEIDSKSCLFRSCGHFVHNSCKERYFHTLYERYHRGQPVEGQNVVDYTIGSGEFICPVCRRLANCIVRICIYLTVESLEGTAKQYYHTNQQVPFVPSQSAASSTSSNAAVTNYDKIFEYMLKNRGDEGTDEPLSVDMKHTSRNRKLFADIWQRPTFETCVMSNMSLVMYYQVPLELEKYLKAASTIASRVCHELQDRIGEVTS